jgi:hypothetical protein
MAIDPILVGFWERPGTRIRFGRDDWLYRVGTIAFAISPDGMELNVGTSVYQRVLGNGPVLSGDWRLVEQDAGSTWIEDVHYRDDGTYVSTWTKDGLLDSVSVGYYTVNGANLDTEEKRALVATGPGAAIHLDYPYDTDETGTYAVSADGVLTLTIAGQNYIYAPVTN